MEAIEANKRLLSLKAGDDRFSGARRDFGIFLKVGWREGRGREMEEGSRRDICS